LIVGKRSLNNSTAPSRWHAACVYLLLVFSIEDKQPVGGGGRLFDNRARRDCKPQQQLHVHILHQSA
jgi:hypothetical protein